MGWSGLERGGGGSFFIIVRDAFYALALRKKKVHMVFLCISV